MNRTYSLALSPLLIVAGCAAPVPSHLNAYPASVAAASANVDPTAAAAVVKDSHQTVPDSSDESYAPAAAEIAPVVFQETSSGAAGEGLELAELEATAFGNHPALREQQTRIAALRGRWVQAGLPPNPTAQYAADEMGVDDAAGLHSLALAQTLVTADKLALQQSVIAAEIRRAEANFAADRLRVQTDVRRRFTAALVAQRRLELAEQLREIAEQSTMSVSQMLAAAEVSRVALLQAQTESQQSELAVETAEANLAGARRQLAAVVGVAALPAEPLVGDLSRELPEIPYDAALAQLIASSPELADRAAAVERAQRSLRLACAQVTPNINFQAGAGYDAASDDTFSSVQITVPLPILDRNQGAIRRYRSEIAAASLALDRAELNLGSRLAEALQQYETARLRVVRLRQEIVPRAEETLELSRTAFEVGESNYLQLLTAQRTLFQVQLEMLTAIEQARQASALIDGFLLDGSLSSNAFQPALD